MLQGPQKVVTVKHIRMRVTASTAIIHHMQFIAIQDNGTKWYCFQEAIAQKSYGVPGVKCRVMYLSPNPKIQPKMLPTAAEAVNTWQLLHQAPGWLQQSAAAWPGHFWEPPGKATGRRAAEDSCRQMHGSLSASTKTHISPEQPVGKLPQASVLPISDNKPTWYQVTEHAKIIWPFI